MSALSSLTVSVTTRVTQLAAINLTALLVCVAGLGVFGLGPAMVASFWAVARLEERSASDLMRGMIAEAWSEALRANILLLPVFALVAVLAGVALLAAGPFAGVVAALAVLVAAFALALAMTLATLRGGLADGWINAITALALVPYRLLVSLLAMPFVLLIAAWQPPLGLFFGLSAWAWLVHLIVTPGLASAIPNKTEVRP